MEKFFLEIYTYIHVYLPSWRWVRPWNIFEKDKKPYSQITH